mgnify:CR=1 FL=1
MKFKYIPGIRPTPMLMFYNEPNLEVYEGQIKDAQSELNLNFKNLYKIDDHHYWNNGVYIIFNDKYEVISHVISHFPNLLYLLRAINKPLIFEFNDNEIKIFKEDLDKLCDELKRVD